MTININVTRMVKQVDAEASAPTAQEHAGLALSQCRPTANPIAAPAKSSHAELRRWRARSTPLATANPAVVPSMIAARPSSQVTAAKSASDATLTPSRKALAVCERRTRGSKLPMSATLKTI